MIHVKESLDALPEYQAGRLGNPTAALAVGETLLSSNELPFSPVTPVATAIHSAVASLNRYPSMSNDDLRHALALRYGVKTEHVVVGCGGVEIGRLAAATVLDTADTVVFGTPSFQEYTILCGIHGAIPVTVPLDDSSYDLNAISSNVSTRTRLVIICNPNNPTGTGVPTSHIEAFLHTVPDSVLVLIDEAYWEFTCETLGESSVSLVAQWENVVVLRSFSKAFGLAGLRVGYGICGSHGVASAMRKMQLPFSVNSLASVAALAALHNEAAMLGRVREIVRMRDALRDELVALGYVVPPSYTNFLFLQGASGLQFAVACEAENIMLRRVGNLGVRITIGTEAENDRAIEVARDVARGVERR